MCSVFYKCGSPERYTDVVKLWKKRKETDDKIVLTQFFLAELNGLHFLSQPESEELIDWVITKCEHWYDNHVSFAKNVLNIEPLV